MRFIKKQALSALMPILALTLSFALIIPLFVFPSAAKADTAYSYTVGGINVYPKTGTVTVYTDEYGATCGGKDSYNALEIVVSEGRVVSVGGVDNAIPEGGFVAMVRGSGLTTEIEALSLGEGDTVIFDEFNMEILFINENYSPFYSDTISFDRYNSTRTENTIIIYNSGATTKTNIWGTEVVVDAEGFVASIGGNDNTIPKGGFVISAVGKDRMAELTNAAVLGLAVTVDNDAKTVTFAFSKESIVGGMSAEYNNFVSDTEAGKAVFANLNYIEIEKLLAQMESCLNSADEAIKADDIAAAMVKKYEFAKLQRQSEKLTVEYPAVEARAIWLRPTASDTRIKVNETVKAIHEAGYNAVCIELLFNSVTIFSVDTDEYLFSQDPLLNGFDVLEAYIDECHKYGIEVHGWMTCYRVSHGSSTNRNLAVSTLKPEWLCMAKSGTVEVGDTKGYFLNPALPEVSEFLLKFYRYILNTYSLDGFQLDYIRYPYAAGEDFGYDDYTRSLFEDEYGTDPINLTSSSSLWNDWCRFRAAFVTDFVGEVSQLVKEIRPDIYLSADVAPDYRDVYAKYMQEAEIWLTEKLIDMAFPMAYGTNVVPLYSSFTVAAAGDYAYAYIGLGDYGTDILKREIVETRQAGGDGFAFFSWSQYVSGNYVNEIASSILSWSSLSPSYNASEALHAQAEYMLERISSIIYINSSALSSEAENIVTDAAYGIMSTLKKKTAESCKDDIQSAYDGLKLLDLDENVKTALLADMAKALKIASLSKDEAKSVYYETHPLPDKYQDEAPGDESGEASREESESAFSEESDNESATLSEKSENAENNDGMNRKTILITAFSVLGATLAALAIYIIIKRRNSK
ncbi:MAG: family 10 glycosylhydrolase [Eubacteriales bacterium]|nr:family 10 glycosylhydrolase [Eubacteriales bacterium]